MILICICVVIGNTICIIFSISLPALSLASSILRSFSGKSNASRMSERATERCKKSTNAMFKSKDIALTVADPGFPRRWGGGATPEFVAKNLIFGQIFAENYVKIK